MLRTILLATLLLGGAPARAETCHFTGTTSHDGHLTAAVTVTQADELTTVDATVSFGIHAWMTDYRYLGQEITTWRGRELLSVAVNQRSLAGSDIKRQQWDVFRRVGDRLEASRVQAKYLTDFGQRHPGFISHWPPATFGQPWLADYRRATPERRPDLDLPATGAHTPLATALYWSRFLPDGGGTIALVLPSFKRDKQVALTVAPPVPGEGWRRWSAPLRYPKLQASPPSLVAAWVSPDHYLLQLGVELHTEWAAGQAILRAEGCQGVQIAPTSVADSGRATP